MLKLRKILKGEAMRILSHDIIYSVWNTPELSSCAFPSVTTLSNGDIFASFKGGETKGPYNKTDRTVVCISHDGGKSFGEPVEFFEPPVVGRSDVRIISSSATDFAPTESFLLM